MNRKIENEVIVVIRSAGERTKNACFEIVKQQLPEENIYIIEEKPFEEAIRKCYKIGIESGKKWMFTIDADVLISQKAIRLLYAKGEKLNVNVFMFNGIIFDKLFLSYRTGGLKGYRIEKLSTALNYIPENGQEIRPENYTLKKMTEAGHKKFKSTIITGIHDFEQYYKDIYRKSFLHARKHSNSIALLPKWRELAQNDPDYTVAIKGFMDGYLEPDFAKTDSRIYAQKADRALQELQLTEKSELQLKELNNLIEQVIDEAGPAVDVQGIMYRYKYQISKQGMNRGLKWCFGDFLQKAGTRIKK